MDDRLAQLRTEADQISKLLDARRKIYNAAIREILATCDSRACKAAAPSDSRR